MKVHLIALPWAARNWPSIAIASLAGFLQREEPGWDVQTHHAFLELAASHQAAYDAVAARCGLFGEYISARLLYRGLGLEDVPWDELVRLDRRDEATRAAEPDAQTSAYWAQVCAELLPALDQQLDQLSQLPGLSGSVVGLTTSMGQLFSSLVLAQRIKQRHAECVVVLGGAALAPIADAALAEHFPWNDFVIRGEGEAPLLALLRRLQGGEPTAQGPRPPTYPRVGVPESGWEQLADLNQLALPDFGSAFDTIKASASSTSIPLEGSRGCWWDRSHKTPRQACGFCNTGSLWCGYRHKSAERIVAEMEQLARQHHLTEFCFLDQVLGRPAELEQLVEALQPSSLRPHFFAELRAGIAPDLLVRLWRVGLRQVQVGVEALSTPLLRCMGKGTTTMMNLEIMRQLEELQIAHGGNLILDYPGSTAADVAATQEVIERFGRGMSPLHISGFYLDPGSVVHRFPEEHDLHQVRNYAFWGTAVPGAVLEQVPIGWQDFMGPARAPDWSPVRQAVKQWHVTYRPRSLVYHDGGTFLRVVDKRKGEDLADVLILDETTRAIYLHCLQSRSFKQIVEHISDGAPEEVAQIRAALEDLVENDVMFTEQDRYLSLATAPSPAEALERMDGMGK